MHAGGLLAAAQTTGSLVSDLRPHDQRHWATATAAPCLSLFKPVSISSPLPAAPAPPNERADPESLWWRHERLHRAVLRDPEPFASRLAERDALEHTWLQAPPDTAQAFAAHRQLLDRWLGEIGSPPDRRPAWARHYWAKRNRRAGLSPAPG
jgi:dipeptidase